MDDDGSSMSPGASPPTSQPRSGEPPGLRAQIGATVEAVKRLLRAHVDLAKTELGEIVGEVKRMVALAGVALGALLLMGILLTVGLLLFLGEWLFGSLGWGVLLGTLLLVDIAAMALLLALDVKGGRIGLSLLTAAIIGASVGVVMGLDLTHRGWTALGDALAPQFDPNTRAVLLAAGISAAVLGLLGLLTGIRGGVGSAVGRLIAGAVLGAVVGLVTVVSIPPTVGAALGVLVGLIAWPVFAGLDLLRAGVDGEAMMRKFMPRETIELTKETIEWVRARTPLVPKS